jgi:TonB family protein
MFKRASGLLEISASSPRLMLAIVLSVLLHLALVLRFAPPAQEGRGVRASLTVSLSGKTVNSTPPAAPGGAPPPGPVNFETYLPDQAPVSATPAPAQEARTAVSSEAAAPAGVEATRKVTFFANATMLGTFPAADAAGFVVLQNPAYLPVDNLSPRPQLPAGFNLAYPDAARAAGLKATVNIAVLIDENGRVVEAVGVDDSPQTAVLASAAVQALRRTRFEPGQRGGSPVKSKAVVTVRFGYE